VYKRQIDALHSGQHAGNNAETAKGLPVLVEGLLMARPTLYVSEGLS